ncbi:MAG: peptide chain release factor N(5)-glutamine methyltransferase [Candidatus Moranbacteria bacterium CG_4_9_14_3_um_filter_42_9]|nr:MAG: peptide chain release factor N(5)-glutamine methyltransferase [Candidatus Moranbacteria bacterium CG_4_9_14_3_um_filter_42_9]
MLTIKDILNIYHSKIDYLDLELLISAIIGKPREFVMSHPEYRINSLKIENLKLKIARRADHEPIAYILGQKEFYGLNFRINKNTLIPRPESELLVERALDLLRSMLRSKLRNTIIIDVGTGSGNIIISIAQNLLSGRFYGIDISENALLVARQNAKLHKVSKRIKFIRGNLLEPLLKTRSTGLKDKKIIIVANLPYLAKNIYASASPDIKKYEPRLALLSGKNGLAHYEKLLIQTKKLSVVGCRLSVFMEISPEQKSALQKMIKSFFSKVKIAFHRDLSDRWRVCQIEL